MGLKSFAKAAVVATAVAVTSVSLIAQPASAATTINFKSAQGQLDNNPANRAQSWVWVYAGNTTSTSVEYAYYNGTVGRISAKYGKSASVSLGQDIWRIRVCIAQLVAGSCSAWS